jgi:predicted dehydrogenase
MAPIRVGFQGISADTPKCWANFAHLPYFQKSSDYKIVALCNSSIESGKRAVEFHKLDPSIKLYASPEELAADPEVDMVVCSVNVAKHYNLIKPAILAGKLPVVEWPLASNVEQAEELTNLAKEKGLKTLVILQGRMSPVTKKVRQLIADGKVGDVLSVNLDAVGGYHGEDPIGVGGMYLSDRKVGGNMATIHFGHGT